MDHPERVTVGFASAAAAYQRGRPGYPAGVLEVFREHGLALLPGRRALDVGAGTGKFTALLASSGAAVLALELVPTMLAELALALPEVHALGGEAHAVPLARASVDLVTAATAFHWFADDEAFRELARVLRPGGLLATISNRRDTSEPLGAGFEAILARRRPPGVIASATAEALVARSPHFDLAGYGEVAHHHLLAPGELADLALSMSYIAPLDEAARGAVVAEVAALVAGEGPLALGYRTEVACFRRR